MTTEDHVAIAEQVAAILSEKLRPLSLLRTKEAAAKIKVSRTRFYELRKSCADFPAQIKFDAAGISGYYEHELEEWMRRNGRR